MLTNEFPFVKDCVNGTTWVVSASLEHEYLQNSCHGHSPCIMSPVMCDISFLFGNGHLFNKITRSTTWKCQGVAPQELLPLPHGTSPLAGISRRAAVIGEVGDVTLVSGRYTRHRTWIFVSFIYCSGTRCYDTIPDRLVLTITSHRSTLLRLVGGCFERQKSPIHRWWTYWFSSMYSQLV